MKTMIVVTPFGPFTATEKVYEAILAGKLGGKPWAGQVLFMLEVDVKEVKTATVSGAMPKVTSVEEFLEKYISLPGDGKGAERNIII